MIVRALNNNQLELQFKAASLAGYAYLLLSYGAPVGFAYRAKYYRTTKLWSTTTERHLDNWMQAFKPAAIPMPQEFFDGIYAQLGWAANDTLDGYIASWQQKPVEI